MDRLTKRQAFTVGGVIYAKCEHCQDKRPECFGEQCPVPDEALISLAAYEDTGLEPEEIKQMCALARLNSNIFDNDFGNHIAELIVAEQDGRLLVLPCKVGGTVYFVADGAVKETRLLAIKANVSDPAYSGNPSIIYEGYFQLGMHVMCWSIGNRLYLTRAEADAALKDAHKPGGEQE